ncbi:MAG: (Fe-S)-binding protein [Candidatus Rokubacteria bacterium]|nr:(Fe-S)-binding protein [Candidatus Rokubacteria bacterium]
MSLVEYVAAEAQAVLDRCTACGKCVEICPVTPHVDLGGETPESVTRSILGVLRSGAAPDPGAAAWAHACNGCGDCIPACPEGVNPRKMLVLANTLRASEERRTPELFRKMSRAVRLMAGMQLVPREYARLLAPPVTREVPVVFYLGCNALRTPHLLFNAMYVLDAIGVDYEVLGGPGVCCGIIHAKWEGEARTAEQVTSFTLTRFADFKPEKVLSWCPSCQLHLGETLAGFRQTSFDLDHVTTFFVEHAARLREQFTRPVARRVVLHAHTGFGDLSANVATLLSAIPGLTLLDTVLESGYTCGGSGCSRAPALMAIEHAQLLDRVRETGADTLVTFYHGCHAAFLPAEKDGRARVLNFTDLLVEALGGTPHDDVLKRYRLADDAKLVLEEGVPHLRANGIEVDPALLERILPELFSLAEFRGGLSCFSSPT